ncbi:zinc-dependent alcohol dehydrogenase family protein [Paraburkholderia elongata]|uniref:enoyl-[acyl-carrier-protein] reductase n=1 Tax=Paraburkholderia elongata TaxID=2675747 RepID=A0A972NY89_9BURK|nr:zinc-dependent alcohol dehydrogenase family protein [Paraburkholderia elongata]NPT62088.1 alcohol dehydrogenase catalytic domain-containing protein [Paraburkholderia elongata]
MKAVVLKALGEPSTVLEFRELPEPEKPGAGEALVAVDYAPINFSDMLVARGRYAIRPELPSVIGNEGVGRVLELGEGVTNLRVGDRVILPMGSFTWRERMIARAHDLIAVPQAIDPRQAAMLAINAPSAYLLINAYVDLKRGDWIALNAANSAISRWLVGFAKRKGANVLGLVRRAEAVSAAMEAGCDLVLLDVDSAPEQFADKQRPARIRLALDAIGGESSGRLVRLLGPAGTLVSYAGQSFSSMVTSPFDVIFNDLTIRGFSIGNPHFANQIAGAIVSAAEMVASGEISIPIAAEYGLEEIGAAIVHAEKGGKVLLKVAS